MSSLGKTVKDVSLAVVGSVGLVSVLLYGASKALKHLHLTTAVPALTPGDLACGLIVVVSLRWTWLYIRWLEKQVAE